MTTPRRIRLQALVGAREAAMVSGAAERLSLALGEGFRVEAEFPAGAQALDRAADPCLVLTSLLAEAEAIDEAWNVQERRLDRLYADLTADPRVVAYVCTVFRHVAPTSDADERRRRLGRIRRLNLLATDLSRRTGLNVIDIDRALADVGARPLATDHRLGGPAAAAAVAACVAGVVLATGLDGVVAFGAQQAAVAALAGQSLPVSDEASEPATVPTRLRPPPPGGRGGPEAYWRDLIRGKLTRAEAAEALARAVSSRGLGPTLTLAFAGARRLWRSRSPARR